VPLVWDQRADRFNLAYLSAGRRSIQVFAACLAVAVAASMAVRPEKGLEWMLPPDGQA